MPSKHQVSDAPTDVEGGQTIEPVENDAGDDPDAGSAMDGDVGADPDADAPQDAQVDAGPRCDCTDPEQPICIEATGLCVQCRKPSDCEPGEHCLVATGQCVGCLDSTHCAGRAHASFCDPTTNACAGCRDGVDSDCSNVPDLNVCQAGTCVQCAGARRAACGETAAACSASFACEGCKADADCQRFGKVCDEPSGRCVTCTVDSEGAQCGGKSCNPASHVCTQTDRASVELCSPCLADSECKANHRCIALKFQGLPRGGYCMKRVSSGCSEPFGAAPLKRTSLSGAASDDYCGLIEDTTSCEAILALLSNRICATGDAAECGAAGAVCGNVNGLTPPRCSYACEASAQCPTSIPCPVGGSDRYCGKL